MEELEAIRKLTRKEALEFYGEVLKSPDKELVRWLGRNDRFFLLGCLMGREDVLGKDWCYERCREVEAEPDGRLDLWSRFHYKSTIITLAGAVQEILKDPEITIGILSYNRPTANKFVDQIRRALESETLSRTYPEILYEKPPRVNWSSQTGLIVKRRDNPKEATVQGSGLVDGQPTGAHFRLRIYDDVVTVASVTTPEQIRKTTEAWELSLALGTDDGGRAWYAGTRYHIEDTYAEMLRRGTVRERRRICVDGAGRALMMTDEALEKLKRDMGGATYSAQMLQDPVASGVRVFEEHWLRWYDQAPRAADMNVYIFVDGASSKKAGADYTVMAVVGMHRDENYYLLDMVHEHLSLSERGEKIFELVRKWRPVCVFWEQVGAMSDVEHVRWMMEHGQGRFNIVELKRAGLASETNKDLRIRNLQPLFEAGRWVLPRVLPRAGADGAMYDAAGRFLEEYKNYPVVKHDDILDALADVCDRAVREKVRFAGDWTGRSGATGAASDWRQGNQRLRR